MSTKEPAYSPIPGRHIKQFSAWLTAQGCEIQPATNEFEVIRFRCQKGTGVVYNGKKGYTISSPMVYEAYECFVNGRKWEGKGKPSKRAGGSKRTRQLIDRDGNRCFYCDKEMAIAEMTKEHLLSVNHGGADRLENMVLACQQCNIKAGHLPVIEKVKLRDECGIFKLTSQSQRGNAMSEDSEIGEAFRAMREANQEKKRSNLDWSTAKLQELGVPFESKNLGVHLVVTGKDGIIDFWPSTGKFIQRKPRTQGRGIMNLLKLCEVSK